MFLIFFIVKSSFLLVGKYAAMNILPLIVLIGGYGVAALWYLRYCRAFLIAIINLHQLLSSNFVYGI